MNIISLSLLALVVILSGCAVGHRDGYVEGPDKQGAGMVDGALSGAGAGAVTGAQLGSPTGIGALVGAGFGAVAGSVHGALMDVSEEEQAELSRRTAEQLELARAHEILSEHYQRRLELHPSRDIFPADLFFRGDEVELRPGATHLVREIARLNKDRLPWSRLVIASYAKAVDKESPYAQHLAQKRARALTNEFVRAGIEPRRVTPRAVIMKEPVLIDPHDDPQRYNQAIELIPVDR